MNIIKNIVLFTSGNIHSISFNLTYSLDRKRIVVTVPANNMKEKIIVAVLTKISEWSSHLIKSNTIKNK